MKISVKIKSIQMKTSDTYPLTSILNNENTFFSLKWLLGTEFNWKLLGTNDMFFLNKYCFPNKCLSSGKSILLFIIVEAKIFTKLKFILLLKMSFTEAIGLDSSGALIKNTYHYICISLKGFYFWRERHPNSHSVNHTVIESYRVINTQISKTFVNQIENCLIKYQKLISTIIQRFCRNISLKMNGIYCNQSQ